MDWGWICGGLIGVMVLALLVLFFVIAPITRRKEAEKTARIEEHGHLVYCHIVVANPDLYKEQKNDDYSYAQVVYTHDDPPDTDQLVKFAKKLKVYKASEGASKEDKIISSVMSSHFPYFIPLPLPLEVAGDVEAYTVSVNVHWNKLSKNRLTRDHLWCKVIEGEDGGIRMVNDSD